MREIRFRAWDKKRKHWDYFSLNNIIQYQKYLNEHLINGDEFYLYTGLKDKNGKEIWEGDILKYQQFKIPVKLDDYKLMVMIRDEYAKYGEIIGNLYENQELLETK